MLLKRPMGILVYIKGMAFGNRQEALEQHGTI